MSDEELKVFQEAVEKGLWNSIEIIGGHNLKYVPWFSIMADKLCEDFEDNLKPFIN